MPSEAYMTFTKTGGYDTCNTEGYVLIFDCYINGFTPETLVIPYWHDASGTPAENIQAGWTMINP